MNNIINLIAVKLNIEFDLIELVKIEVNYYLFKYKNLLIKYFLNDYPVYYYIHKNKFSSYYKKFAVKDNIVIKENFVSSMITNANINTIKNKIKGVFGVDITPKIEYIDVIYHDDVEIIEQIIKNTKSTGEHGFLLSHLKLNSKYFYHFGSPSCKERFISKENLYIKMIESTKSIIELCKQRKQKLIFASSAGVYETKTLEKDYPICLTNKINTKHIDIYEPETYKVNTYTSCKPRKLDVKFPSLYDPVADVIIDENETLQDLYNQYKLECENMIIKELDDYLILRIPRVYGKDSNKGLLNPFRTNYELQKELEYMDVNDWVAETNQVIDKYGIYEYKNLKKDTIENILKKYKNY